MSEVVLSLQLADAPECVGVPLADTRPDVQWDAAAARWTGAPGPEPEGA